MSFPASQSNANNTNTPRPMTAPGDPFGGGANIFQVAAQKKAQAEMPDNTPMPPNMPQQPPQHKTEQPMQNSMTGGTGEQPQQQQQPNKGASPLDEFVSQSDNNNEAGGSQQQQPQQQQQQQQSSIFDTKIEDLMAVAERQDYAGEITPETIQQIMQGDISALSGLLNQVGRRAFANAAFASSRMASKGVSEQFERFQNDTLPNVLKDNSFAQARQGIDHSILKHPSVAPLVDAQMNNLRNQFPNATPEEIRSMTEKFFESFASELTGTNQRMEQEQQQQQNAGPTDLQKLFGF